MHPMEAETVRILDEEMGFNFTPQLLSLEDLAVKEMGILPEEEEED